MPEQVARLVAFWLEQNGLEAFHEALVQWMGSRRSLRKPSGRGEHAARRAAKALAGNVVVKSMKPFVSDTPRSRVFGQRKAALVGVVMSRYPRPAAATVLQREGAS